MVALNLGVPMQSRQRTRQWKGLAVRLIVAGLATAVLVYAWLSHDTSAPDDSQLRLPPATAVRAEDDGFVQLRLLRDRLEQAGLNRRRVPESYNDRTREAADEILRLDVVRQLPERLDEIMKAPAFEPPPRTNAEAVTMAWRGTLNIVPLLRLQMQRQLHAGAGEEAWRTAQLGLRFNDLLRAKSDGFHELNLAHMSQDGLIKAILAGIDANQWSANQLRALVSLPEPTQVAARLMQGLRAEYAFIISLAEEVSTEVGGLRRRVVYHPNRTKRAWLDVMAEPITALREGDLVRAHQAIVRAETGSGLHTSRFRNALGYRMIAGSIGGNATAIALAVDATAQVRLLRLRAAMALYRLQQGTWPVGLEGLVGPYIPAMPLDPWSTSQQPLRYALPQRRLYSIGVNQHDDSGQFDDDLSHRKDADYGVRLPEPSNPATGGTRP